MGNEIRYQVLNFSLLLESCINKVLAYALGIPDVEKSKSFNYTNQSLSFNQKVNLLLDINLINKEDHWKFQTLMEIRNKFIHVLEIDSYIKCFEYVSAKKKIVDTYSKQTKKDLDEEQHLHACCLLLYTDVVSLGSSAFINLLGKVIEDVETKIDAAAATAHKELFEVLINKGVEEVNLNAYWKIYTERLEKLVAEKGIGNNYRFSPFLPPMKRVSIKFQGIDGKESTTDNL